MGVRLLPVSGVTPGSNMSVHSTRASGVGSVADSRGLVRIPHDVRESLDIEKGDKVQFATEDGEVAFVTVLNKQE